MNEVDYKLKKLLALFDHLLLKIPKLPKYQEKLELCIPFLSLLDEVTDKAL